MRGHDAHDPNDANDHSVLEPVSAPAGEATPRNVRIDTETVTQGAGGFVAGVGGLALGATAGPVGAILGALAGAIGGWWAGREVANALTDDDDRFYRAQYEDAADRLADRSYEQVRAAYVAGHLAGRNPDWSGRSFAEIEPDLHRGWQGQRTEWPAVRGYAQSAFERARQR